MKSKSLALMMVAAVMLVYGVAEATEVTLNQVTFPERNQIEIDFVSDQRAPEATMTAEVEYGEGQAEMNIRYKEMKPAILFGGDVTCYVLWAVTRDGTVENMGELWVRDDSETVEYSTGQKSFAMMVTAEPHPLVTVPSDLVMFRSLAAETKNAPSESFTFSGFASRAPNRVPVGGEGDLGPHRAARSSSGPKGLRAGGGCRGRNLRADPAVPGSDPAGSGERLLGRE